MDKLKLVQVLLSVAGISLGQLFLKLAALNLHNPKAVGIWVGGMCLSVHLFVGIGLLGISTLLWIWVLLFTVNVGAVARSQTEVWPIMGAGDEATVRMFFSPSCPS